MGSDRINLHPVRAAMLEVLSRAPDGLHDPDAIKGELTTKATPRTIRYHLKVLEETGNLPGGGEDEPGEE